MARSVVLKGTVRCAGCQLAPRWCICEGMTPVTVPFGVDVLMHYKEAYRPSSTGRLLGRLVTGSMMHEYRPDQPTITLPRHEAARPVWVLHPSGEALPTGPLPSGLRVVLIDGSWAQAAGMLRVAASSARCIRLPMTGVGRYRLRSKQEGGRFSTMEALMFLCAAVGATEAETALRLRFELHVYAGLLSRGRAAEAATYLQESPVGAHWPALIRKLQPVRGLPEIA